MMTETKIDREMRDYWKKEAMEYHATLHRMASFILKENKRLTKAKAIELFGETGMEFIAWHKGLKPHHKKFHEWE